MTAFKYANLALSFFLELGILVALGYWGFQSGQTTLLKIVLGIGLPLLTAVVWGLFAAPKSSRRLKGLALMIFKVAAFGIAIIALAVAGQPSLAGIFALAVVINLTLGVIWRQEETVVG